MSFSKKTDRALAKMAEESRSRARPKKSVPREVKQYVNTRIAGSSVHHYKPDQITYSETNAASLYDLSADIAPYTGATSPNINRTGDEAHLMSLQLRGNLRVADNTNIFKILIFRWHPNTVAFTPTEAHIHKYLGHPESPYNEDERKQYTILYEKLHYLSETSKPIVPINIKLFGKKVANKPMLYSANNANTGQDHIYLYLQSDSTLVANPALNVFIQAMWKGD